MAHSSVRVLSFGLIVNYILTSYPPLTVFSLTFMYENARDDEIMKQTADRVMARSIALGQELGRWHRFIYQNYAGPGQDAFAGYGQENRARLLNIQHKYDPTGVFQRLQPGYFKL